MTEREFDVARALTGLRKAVRATVPVPAAAAVRARAERRLRVRRVGTALTAAVAVVAVAVGATTVARWGATPVPPAGTPTPRPSRSVPAWPVPEVADPIAKVDWASATIMVPPRPGCPSGRLMFSGGSTPGWPRIALALPPEWPLAYGDLTGDGRPEAIIEAVCVPAAEGGSDAPGQLLVISRGLDGTLTAIAWVGPLGGLYRGHWVAQQTLIVEAHPWHADWGYTLGAALAYRLQGGRFVEVGSGYPGLQPVHGATLGPPIDLGPDSGPVATALGCTGGWIRLEAGDRLGGVPGSSAALGSVVFSLEQPEAGLNVGHLVDLAGDGTRRVLVAITCYDATTSRDDAMLNGVGVRGHGVLVLDHGSDGVFRAVDLVPVPLGLHIGGWSFDRGRLTVTSFEIGTGLPAPAQTWVWNGDYFQPG